MFNLQNLSIGPHDGLTLDQQLLNAMARRLLALHPIYNAKEYWSVRHAYLNALVVAYPKEFTRVHGPIDFTQKTDNL